MDVLCVGMYRACSTWQYDVAAHLVERHRKGRRLGFVQSSAYAAGESASWRVLKSHEGGPAFRRALCGESALAIYAIRDVRDVVYSMLHKRAQSFDAFLRQGMIHQILANHAFWTAMPARQTLCQRYETLVADPDAGVREIAAFLGISLSPEARRSIVREFSFEANKQRTRLAAARLEQAGVDLSAAEHAVWFDPESLLHWNHLREGRVGSWRDSARPREIAILMKITGPWLVQHGYATRQDVASAGRISGADRAAIARGWAACRLRCASLRFPRLAARLKRLVGMRETYQARPVDPIVERAA